MRGLLQGRSVLRIEHDLAMTELARNVIPEHVLEVGAKSFSHGLLGWLPGVDQDCLTTIGLDPDCDLWLDLDTWPEQVPLIPRNTNVIILTNLIEHLGQPALALETLGRILDQSLDPGARVTVLGSTPFVHKFHPDPFDYWRPTQQGIAALFGEGFDQVEVRPYGVGPGLVAGHVIASVVPINWVRVLVWVAAKCWDWLFRRMSRDPNAWYLGVAWRAELTISN